MNFEHMPYPAHPMMEKEAIFAPVWAGLRYLGGKALKSTPMRFMSSRINDNAVMRAAAPLGARAENALARGVGAISPQHAAKAQRLLKGVSKPLMREGFGGAVTGAALGGGLNAAFAEDGNRLNAFASGAASGAWYGGVGGVLQGGGQGIVKNLRSEGIKNIAKQYQLPAGRVGTDIHKMKMWDAVKNSFSGKAAPLQKDMARQKLMGAPAAVGATFVLPNLYNPSAPEDPPAPPPAPKQPNLVPNTPGAYYQKQVTASAVLRPIDFSKLPG